MKSSVHGISIPDAIKKLFGIELAQHKAFKDLVYPLARSKGFLKVIKEPMGLGSTKNHLFIDRDDIHKLYNAVLLQGFFADSKRVRDIFNFEAKRLEAAEFLELIICGRQSIIGIAVQSQQVHKLVDRLKSPEPHLTTEPLPNPFKELPQLSLNGLTSVIQVLLAQSAVISEGESMVIQFLNGDLEKAYEYSCQLNTNDRYLQKYQTQIQKEYREANEFDDLLKDLLN